MEGVNQHEELSLEELSRILDIAGRLSDVEIIPDATMCAYHYLRDSVKPIEDHNNILMYDHDWNILLREGASLPAENDERRLLEDSMVDQYGKFYLINDALYKTRPEYVEYVRKHAAIELEQLVESGMEAYEKLVEEVGQEDANFLLALVGVKIVDDLYQAIPIGPVKLKQAHDTLVLMKKSMRDFFRDNAELMKQRVPELVEALSGTPTEGATGVGPETAERVRESVMRLLIGRGPGTQE